MGSYSVAVRATNVASQLCCWELRTAAGVPALIFELGISIAGNSSNQIYVLARAPIRGITPTSPVTVLADDNNGPAGNTQVAIAWSGAPPALVASNYLRRLTPNVPSGVGSGIIWTFPIGLLVPPASSLALFTLSIASALDIWVNLDE